MTRIPDVPAGPPPTVPGPGALPAERAPGLRAKAWLLFTLPLGVTTFAAFLYIGIRARRRRWLAWAGVYLATLAGWLVLTAPEHTSSTADGVGAVLWLVTWIGGGVHALVVSSDAVRRIHGGEDPMVAAAQARIERRADGRRLLASQPALAHELGVGRPDVPGSDDFGLIDVNHVPADTLTRLPGITAELAARIAAGRAQAGGFSSVEDLGVLLDLPPATVDGLRDTAVFLKD